MEIWAATYYDSDGYTYGCEVTIGVYSTRVLADDACLRFAEKYKKDLKDFTSAAILLNQDWEGYYHYAK